MLYKYLSAIVIFALFTTKSLSQSRFLHTMVLGSTELQVRRMLSGSDTYSLDKIDTTKDVIKITYDNKETGLFDRFYFKDNICIMYCQMFNEKNLNTVISKLDKEYKKDGESYWIDNEFKQEILLKFLEGAFVVYYRPIKSKITD